MAHDFESLGIRMDTSGVPAAANDLDKVAAAAQRTEQATEQLAPASKAAAQGLRDMGGAGAASVAPLNNSNTAMKAASLTARQYSQAMRLLPAQITDVVTSLASGSPAYLVAIQQGGQIRDSFGGIGNSLRALMTVLTPARLLIGGAVGSAVLLAKAFNDGQREDYEYAKSLALTGNAAGVTTDQLREMAQSVDVVAGTQSQAAATLAMLAGTGRVAADNLREFTLVAQNLERTAGQPIEETVKQFAELGQDPVRAAVKLNQSLNFLTASLYDQIKALQEEGRLTEAGEVAQKALADAYKQRSADLEGQLGSIQRATRATGSFFKEMWDAALALGREDTIDDRIAELKELQAGGQRVLPGRGGGDVAARIAGLERQKKAQEDAAKAQADAAAKVREYVANQEEATKADAARLAELEQLAKFKFAADVSGLQRSLDSSLTGYTAYAAQLEALRNADLVSDKDYYAAKRALIENDAALREKALRDEVARTREENARLAATRSKVSEDKKLSGSEKLRAEQPITREILTNEQKIRDLEAEILKLRVESASALGVTNQEAERAARVAQLQIDQARASAQAYLEVTQQQRARDLASQGLGNRQREFNSGLNDIDDRFAEQRRRLDDQRARGDITQDQYDAQLSIAEEFRDKDRAGYEEYWGDLTKLQSSFFVGAREAFANYADNAANVAASAEEAFTRAFDGMEDALVNFAMTGKLDFKSLADSIIADILRIQIRAQIAQIASGVNWSGLLTSLFGATGGVSGTGNAGSLTQTGPAMLADTGIMRVPRDNQPMILHKDEAVLPAKMNPWAGGRGIGGTTIQIGGATIYADSGTNVAQLHALLQQNNEQVKAEILENFSRERWAT